MTDASTLLLPNQTAVSADVLFNLKPSCVRAKSYRASIPTSNKSTFVPNDVAIMYIPCGRRNTYYDPQQSYLRFTVKNNDATNSFWVDNLATSFINRIDIFHAGNLLDSIQAYNVLASYIKDFQLNTSESIGLSNIYGTSTSYDSALARQGISVGTGQQVTFCIPLLGSVFTNSDKMLPIGQMYDDIRIEITWEALAQSVVANSAAVSAWTILDCQLEAQIIELSDEGQNMVESMTSFDRPVYIHTNSYRHYSSTLATGTTGIYSTLVPARFCSLKNLIVCPRRSAEINDAKSYSISARVNPLIQSYWWRVGSAIVPQRAVSLYNASNTGGAGEAFAEIQKSFHGWNRPDMCSGLPYTQYNAIDLATADTTQLTCTTTGAATSLGANGYKAGFAIGQELETFSNRDGLLLSGLNTISSQVFFEATLGVGAYANLTPYVLDFYSVFDQILVLDAGILSARF
jgi:hypothetical protein